MSRRIAMRHRLPHFNHLFASDSYSAGYCSCMWSEVIGLLGEHGVTRLVDVRTVPRSRAHPQWWKERMEIAFPAAGIEYLHRKALGGLRKPTGGAENGAWEVAGFRGYADYALTQAFAVALDELLGLAAERPTAIMCAEAVWWQCHRRLITDWVLARGVEVTHILAPRRAEAAKLTPFARVDAGRVTYPDLLSAR
jgi:uncharacterized protein (DUF488 family)